MTLNDHRKVMSRKAKVRDLAIKNLSKLCIASMLLKIIVTPKKEVKTELIVYHTCQTPQLKSDSNVVIDKCSAMVKRMQ